MPPRTPPWIWSCPRARSSQFGAIRRRAHRLVRRRYAALSRTSKGLSVGKIRLTTAQVVKSWAALLLRLRGQCLYGVDPLFLCFEHCLSASESPMSARRADLPRSFRNGPRAVVHCPFCVRRLSNYAIASYIIGRYNIASYSVKEGWPCVYRKNSGNIRAQSIVWHGLL